LVIDVKSPIADLARLVILAQATGPSLRLDSQGPPHVLAGRFESADQAQIRKVGQYVLTVQAARVLIKDQLLAMIAMKDLHGVILCIVWRNLYPDANLLPQVVCHIDRQESECRVPSGRVGERFSGMGCAQREW
jgi:hypothetical protein